MTNDRGETPQDEPGNVSGHVYNKLFYCDDTLTKDYVRHKTHFDINIHELNLSLFRALTFSKVHKNT